MDTKAKIIDENDDSFRKPEQEEIDDVVEATRSALEKITSAKV